MVQFSCDLRRPIEVYQDSLLTTEDAELPEFSKEKINLTS